MKRSVFLWTVHPLQGLVESLLLGLLILFATADLEDYIDQFVYHAALFFLCGACGMWAVLRIRLPQMAWQRQLLWEVGVGVGVSLLMVLVLKPLGYWLHWDALWRLVSWGSLQSSVVLACTGVGYALTRGGVRLWFRWNQLRRRRMLWSLTHDYLMVVVGFAFLAAMVIFLLSPYSGTAAKIWAETKDPFAAFVTGLLVTFFPAFMGVTFLTVVLVMVMFPPLAMFSYFVVRRYTRRLETLASTTADLGEGGFTARVPVDGEDEIARLQTNFNTMAEKLSATLADLKIERDTVSQVLQSRRELIANVSHELRTPLATLRAAVESIQNQWGQLPEASARQKLELAEAEIRQLSALIDDLFILSQADVNHLPLNCAPLDLAALIEQAVSTFAPLAWDARRVEVAAQLPDDCSLPPVMADAQRLLQVLLNLLRNAAWHTPPGGVVLIIARAEKDSVLVEVRDTGEGITAEDLPHIWERFYRGKNAAAESAGLGLALVKELVEAMQGRVAVSSIAGQGSCFVITLPITGVS